MASAIQSRSFGILRAVKRSTNSWQLCRGIVFSTILQNKEPASAASDNKTEVKEDVDYEKVLADKETLLDEAKKQASDFKDKYMRSLAENENIIRRNQKLLADNKLYAIQGFSKDLLEISDILEKATESVSEEELKANDALYDLFQGLNMTNIELHKVFVKHGLEKVNPIGEKFDPNFHEALFQLPDPNKEKGSVAIVQKAGYRLHGRTLRAALVGVVQ